MTRDEMEQAASVLQLLVNTLLGDAAEGEGEVSVSVEYPEDSPDLAFVFADGYDNHEEARTIAEAEAVALKWAQDA